MTQHSHSKPIHQLVLIRGLARESRHWGSFTSELDAAYARAGIEVRIETIDLPGCGRHSEMTAAFSIDETADFLREKFKEILVREAEAGLAPATHRRLVALSLGGMIAASWLSRYPTDFHSGVLINSSLRGVSKIQQRLRWHQWWRIPNILRSNDIEVREARVLDWVSNRRELAAAALPNWIYIQQTRPISKLNFSIQLSAAARFQPPAQILVPLLIVASDRDRMVDPSCSEAIAKRYAAPLIRHPTAGHDLSLDDGPWLASRIAEWRQNT